MCRKAKEGLRQRLLSGRLQQQIVDRRARVISDPLDGIFLAKSWHVRQGDVVHFYDHYISVGFAYRQEPVINGVAPQIDREFRAALPPAVQAVYVGTDCRTLMNVYDDVTPENQRAAFEEVQPNKLRAITGGELEAIPDRVASTTASSKETGA